MLSNSWRIPSCNNFMITVCGHVGERKLRQNGLEYFILLSCMDVSIYHNRELADEGIKGNSMVPRVSCMWLNPRGGNYKTIAPVPGDAAGLSGWELEMSGGWCWQRLTKETVWHRARCTKRLEEAGPSFRQHWSGRCVVQKERRVCWLVYCFQDLFCLKWFGAK